ncbi:MAG: hypothetical protein ACRYFU_20805 [Janthinobacterium lividum]
MKTIDQQQFRALCEEVCRKAPELLQGAANPAERTHRLLRALFVRVCEHLNLSMEDQMEELDDRDGFALLQTLEEHMSPEFSYSAILDQSLLGSGLD